VGYKALGGGSITSKRGPGIKQLRVKGAELSFWRKRKGKKLLEEQGSIKRKSEPGTSRGRKVYNTSEGGGKQPGDIAQGQGKTHCADAAKKRPPNDP